MKKNKKGIWFGAFSSIVVLIFIFGVIGAMRSKLNKFDKTLGEDQLEIAELYDSAQKAPFFIAKSAVPAGEKAAYELGLNGGFSSLQQGFYHDYALWQTETKSSYPDAKKGFKATFQKYLDEYLMEFPDAGIPLTNYNIIMTASDTLKIQGHAIKNIIFPSKPSKYFVWKEEIKDGLSEDERQCLDKEGSVPYFNGGRFSRCGSCPSTATCSDYTNDDYCNLDPCNLGCLSGSFLGFSTCSECTSDMMCNSYVDEESCNRDPCNLNCIWNKDKCREFESNIWYAFTPSFNAEVDYDLRVYDILKLEAKKIIGDSLKCEKTGKELSTCVNEATGRAGSNLIEKRMSFMPLSECGDEDDQEGDKIYKFCVKTNKKVPVYNEETKKFEDKNVMIRFALYMIDLPPEKVGVKLFDHLKESKTIIVKWSKVEDAETYNLYFSKVPFLGKPIVDGKIQGTNKIEVNKSALDSAQRDKNKIHYIDLGRCDPERSILESACVYGDYGSVLTREKPYFIESEDAYLYVVNVPEDAEYYFAVTGVDVSGNENTELVQGTNYASGISVDDN